MGPEGQKEENFIQYYDNSSRNNGYPIFKNICTDSIPFEKRQQVKIGFSNFLDKMGRGGKIEEFFIPFHGSASRNNGNPSFRNICTDSTPFEKKWVGKY